MPTDQDARRTTHEPLIQVYDELLDEQQRDDLVSDFGDLQFATIAYNADGTLPIILSVDDGASVGEISTTIEDVDYSI